MFRFRWHREERRGRVEKARLTVVSTEIEFYRRRRGVRRSLPPSQRCPLYIVCLGLFLPPIAIATAAREGGRSDFSCNLPLISHFVLENEYHSFIDPACLPYSPVPSTLHGGSSMVAWPVSYRTRLSAFPPPQQPPPPPLSPGPNVVSYDRLSVWLEKWSRQSEADE